MLTSHIGLILFATCMLMFILNIDYTAVNLALVPIAKDITADLNSLQWLLSGYVLAWAACVIPSGRFADFYGKRLALTLGLLLFLTGSVLAGMGSSVEALIVGRVIQGIGGAVFSPACYALIFTIVPPHRQGMAMGALAAASGFGLAAGPTLAGLILEELSWRWIFYINLPLGAFVMAIILTCIPKGGANQNTAKIDALGVGLLIIGITACVFSLNQIEIWGFQDYRLWGLMVLGAALLSLFWWRDGKRESQTLPRNLLRNKPLMSTVKAMFLMAFNFSLVLVMMGLYLQSIQRYSAYEAGLIFLSMTLAVGFLGPLGGRIIDRFGVRLPIFIGVSFIGVATTFMSFLSPDTSIIYVISCLALAGLGCGFGFPSINTALFRTAPSAEINTASGIFTMGMMLGNTISVILSTSLLVLFGRNQLAKTLSIQGITLSAAEQDAVVSTISQVQHDLSAIPGLTTETATRLVTYVDQAFLYGFSYNMLLGMSLAILAAFITQRHLKSLVIEPNSTPQPIVAMG